MFGKSGIKTQLGENTKLGRVDIAGLSLVKLVFCNNNNAGEEGVDAVNTELDADEAIIAKVFK